MSVKSSVRDYVQGYHQELTQLVANSSALVTESLVAAVIPVAESAACMA